MKKYIFVGSILIFNLILWSCTASKKEQSTILKEAKGSKYNVLFIAVDDLNDWVSVLGGHPQVQTPNLDKFTKGGSVLFQNGVCAAPICGPSRSAVLSGFMPHRTGVYDNATNMIYTDIVQENATLPEYFSKHGYHTLSDGKIFHKHATEHGVDFGHWAFDEHNRSRRGVKDAVQKGKYYSGKGTINGEKKPNYKEKGAKLSWGPTKNKFEETVDYRVADWARQQLKRDFDKPFFMAIGLIKPHLPWVVPQEYFDKYDLETLETPKIFNDDLKDILTKKGKQIHKPDADYTWVKKHGLEKEATRAYLASVTYADACLGIIFDALEASGHAENTIVVLWGDHGWHLGEKLRYKKNTLWSEVVKTPLLVRMPNMNKMEVSNRTVSLIDLFPTLISLCDLPEKELDGHDFSYLLDNPNSEWKHPGVTVSASGTSVMGERWHFISNLKGSEELYDLKNDPMEWTNLINEPKYKTIVEEMRKFVPKERTKTERIYFKKPPNYVDAEADPTIKPTRDLNKLK